jgi:hypothetical protein
MVTTRIDWVTPRGTDKSKLFSTITHQFRARLSFSQKVSPRGFSKPFHHPGGAGSRSAYDIVSPLSKLFSG